MTSPAPKLSESPDERETLADVVLRAWSTFLARSPSTFASNANVSRRVLYVIGTMRTLVVVVVVTLSIVACGDNDALPPSTDAGTATLCDPSPCPELPRCEALGCSIADISILCVQHGGEFCTCDPDGRGPELEVVCTYPGSHP